MVLESPWIWFWQMGKNCEFMFAYSLGHHQNDRNDRALWHIRQQSSVACFIAFMSGWKYQLTMLRANYQRMHLSRCRRLFPWSIIVHLHYLLARFVYGTSVLYFVIRFTWQMDIEVVYTFLMFGYILQTWVTFSVLFNSRA